jgi:hypothetical protein
MYEGNLDVEELLDWIRDQWISISTMKTSMRRRR